MVATGSARDVRKAAAAPSRPMLFAKGDAASPKPMRVVEFRMDPVCRKRERQNNEYHRAVIIFCESLCAFAAGIVMVPVYAAGGREPRRVV